MSGPVVEVRTARSGDQVYRIAYVWCPADDDLHGLPIDGEGHPVWGFDGNLERPTFEPSILTNYGNGRTCHSYIRNGVWEFLADCSHDDAGKNIPMVPLPDWTAK